MRLLVCAGGTGGGIYPALAAVSELEAQGLDRDQVLWVGTRGEMEEQLIPDAGIRLETIEGGPIVGVSPRLSIPNAAKLTWSIGSGIASHAPVPTGCHVHDRWVHGSARRRCRVDAAGADWYLSS